MKKSVGIIGFGRFGKLLYRVLEPDFDVQVYDVDEAAHAGWAKRASLPEVARAQTIFLCVPIHQLETSLLEIRGHLAEEATVIDVCSVKLEPTRLLETLLPRGVEILPTHPMFGPDSAANGIRNLPFILCPTTRTTTETLTFLSAYLAGRGFRVLQMTAEEHDRITAYSLCLSQLIGRILGELELSPSPSDTQAFQHLLEIRDLAVHDTLALFYNLQTQNPYADRMREAFRTALNRFESEIENWRSAQSVAEDSK